MEYIIYSLNILFKFMRYLNNTTIHSVILVFKDIKLNYCIFQRETSSLMNA